MSCIFCEFVSGKRKIHRIKDNVPFQTLHETKHSISFLSIHCPDHADGHTLVIPKKHYKNLEVIPKLVLHDLIDHVSLIGKALKTKYKDYNILLNNGKYAGQWVMHTHFHLVPRKKGDNCEIEIWNNKDYTPKEFLKMHKVMKKLVNNVKKK